MDSMTILAIVLVIGLAIRAIMILRSKTPKPELEDADKLAYLVYKFQNGDPIPPNHPYFQDMVTLVIADIVQGDMDSTWNDNRTKLKITFESSIKDIDKLERLSVVLQGIESAYPGVIDLQMGPEENIN